LSIAKQQGFSAEDVPKLAQTRRQGLSGQAAKRSGAGALRRKNSGMSRLSIGPEPIATSGDTILIMGTDVGNGSACLPGSLASLS
jgi:hypothetical protein